MAAQPESYEWALARVTQLEVDLAETASALERVQSDNEALRNVHSETVATYRQLQQKHERLRVQLRQEQAERRQLAEEHDRQVTQWQHQLQERTRAFEDLQQRLVVPSDLVALRINLEEEIQERYRQRLADLEEQLQVEQARRLEVHRQAELLRMEAQRKEEEYQDELGEQERKHRQVSQMHERQVKEFEAERQRLQAEVEAAGKVRARLQEREVQLSGLQRTLQEQEQQHSREYEVAAADRQQLVHEVSVLRSRSNDLEVRLDQEERRCSQLAAELEASRREQARLSTHFEQVQAQARAAAHQHSEELKRVAEEHERQSRAAAAAREELELRLQAAEDRCTCLSVELSRAEAQIRRHPDDLAERERELKGEQEQAELRFAAENAALREQLDLCQGEAECQRRTWREREASLIRQVEGTMTQMEALNDELLQCQVAQEDLERRLEAGRLEREATEAACRQLEAETAELHDEVRCLQCDNDCLRNVVRREEHCREVLQANLAEMTTRYHEDRERLMREIDEAYTAQQAGEEQRRALAIKSLNDEHTRHLEKVQHEAKRALHKVRTKYQELRTRSQEHLRRMAQLQQERDMAVRLCEENKKAYEMRLMELNLSRMSYADVPVLSASAVLRAESPRAGGVSHRRELRAVEERLEQQAAWLRTARASATLPSAGLSAGAAPPEAGGS